jgi:hypothetical protein
MRVASVVLTIVLLTFAASPALATSDWTNTSWASECVVSNGYTYTHVYGSTPAIAGSYCTLSINEGSWFGVNKYRNRGYGELLVCSLSDVPITQDSGGGLHTFGPRVIVDVSTTWYADGMSTCTGTANLNTFYAWWY